MGCWLKKHPEYDGCCCKCKHRIQVSMQDDSSLISNTWACVVFVSPEHDGIVYVGGFEHGLCELFERREGLE